MMLFVVSWFCQQEIFLIGIWLWFCLSRHFNSLTANSSAGMCVCLAVLISLSVGPEPTNACKWGRRSIGCRVWFDFFFSVIEFFRNWSLQTVRSDSHLKNIMLDIFMLLWTFVNQKKPFNLYRIFCTPRF